MIQNNNNNNNNSTSWAAMLANSAPNKASNMKPQNSQGISPKTSSVISKSNSLSFQAAPIVVDSSFELFIKDSVIFSTYGKGIEQKAESLNKENKLNPQSPPSKKGLVGVVLYSKRPYKVINATLRGQKDEFKQAGTELYNAYNKETGRSCEMSEFIKKTEIETKYFIECMKEGLQSLPPFVGKAYRGDLLSEEELQNLQSCAFYKGKVFSDKAPLSASQDKGKTIGWTKRPPNYPSEQHRVFYTIESVTGRDISKISEYPDQKEVLFLPDTQFSVVSLKTADWIVSTKTEKVYIAYLKEVK